MKVAALADRLSEMGRAYGEDGVMIRLATGELRAVADCTIMHGIVVIDAAPPPKGPPVRRS